MEVSRRTLLRGVALAGLLAGPVLQACGAAEEGAASSSGEPTTPRGDPTPDGAGGGAEVLVLHHALGLTAGVVAFADRLRAAGHTVHTPDLYDGHTFGDLEDGLAYADRLGLDVFRQRGVGAADGLPADLVYLGFSLGVLPAQELAQTRPRARAAVLVEGCVPPSRFGSTWPDGVPVQVHGMDADPVFAGEGDLANAQALVAEVGDGELFLYPGQVHLFTDSSLPTYDASATDLVLQRVLDLLARARTPDG